MALYGEKAGYSRRTPDYSRSRLFTLKTIKTRSLFDNHARRTKVHREEIEKATQSSLYTPRGEGEPKVLPAYKEKAKAPVDELPQHSSATADLFDAALRSIWEQNREKEAAAKRLEKHTKELVDEWSKAAARFEEECVRRQEFNLYQSQGRVSKLFARPQTAAPITKNEARVSDDDARPQTARPELSVPTEIALEASGRSHSAAYGTAELVLTARDPQSSPLEPPRFATPFQILQGTDRAYRNPQNPLSFSAYRPATAAAGDREGLPPQAVAFARRRRQRPMSAQQYNSESERDRAQITASIAKGGVHIPELIVKKALVMPDVVIPETSRQTMLPSPWDRIPRNPFAREGAAKGRKGSAKRVKSAKKTKSKK